MKNRNLLVVAAAAVLALVAGLVWSLRGGEEPRAPESQPSAVSPQPSARSPDPPRPVPASELARTPAPARPVPLPPVEHVNDAGVVVREHRIEGRPGTPSPIAGVTIADTRQVIEPAVRACMRDIQLPAPARIVVHATLRASGNRISAHNISLSGDGVLGEEARACIIRAYQEFQTDVLPEQADGEDVVHMPWTVP